MSADDFNSAWRAHPWKPLGCLIAGVQCQPLKLRTVYLTSQVEMGIERISCRQRKSPWSSHTPSSGDIETSRGFTTNVSHAHYFLLVLLSSNSLLRLTCTFLLSPPSTFTPLLTSHMPSCTLIVATLPLVPFTACTYGPAIVRTPTTFMPSTGFSRFKDELLSRTSSGSLKISLFVRCSPIGMFLLLDFETAVLARGTSTMRSSAPPSLTSFRSPPTPKMPFLNRSLHQSRYRRVRAGSTPNSRSWVDVRENKDCQVGIFAACWERLRPMSFRNVETSGTKGVGGGIGG